MPLRASLDGNDIFSFNYDENSWAELNKHPVYMHCCESKAVLKKSKLGTLFFAHYRKGDCASKGESAEHIYLKNLIAKVAVRLGWDVATEQPGETPEGERWIADVYCTKGKAKLAFEVQWSPQTNDEFIRRQKKYISSGVRAAWFFRLRGNKEYWIHDLPYQSDTPVFGIKFKEKGVEHLYIPQFDVPVELFIEGMLKGKLKWSPNEGQRLRAAVIPHYESCWKCGKETGIVLGISISDSHDNDIGFRLFSEGDVSELVNKHIPEDCFAKHRIGRLKPRFSKTMGGSYLSNGCFHCDAIMGNFFLSEALAEYSDDFQNPIFEFNFVYGAEELHVSGEWFFNGQHSNHLI